MNQRDGGARLEEDVEVLLGALGPEIIPVLLAAEVAAEDVLLDEVFQGVGGGGAGVPGGGGGGDVRRPDLVWARRCVGWPWLGASWAGAVRPRTLF